MPRPKGWLTPADQWILEYLEDREYATPKQIADDLEYNSNYVTTRCRKLQKADLLTNIGNRGLYQITDRGHTYLDGELDVEELELDE